MNPLTTEWITKAEGDLASALRDWRARKAPNYDGACFHAQQCAEKYLKALLQDNGIAFGKTHDLLILYKPLLPIDPSWATMHDDLDKLTAYAVDFRYPGAYATKQNARDAIAICRVVRQRVRASLGLTS
jgi:HEPN domain-containing protein